MKRLNHCRINDREITALKCHTGLNQPLCKIGRQSYDLKRKKKKKLVFHYTLIYTNALILLVAYYPAPLAMFPLSKA